MTTADPSGGAEVAVSAEFDVPADTLWALLSDFGNLSWIPPVHRSELEGEGPGMIRRMYVTEDSPGIVERLDDLDQENRTVTYSVTANNPLPVDDYVATMVVTDTGAGRCRLDWSCTFEADGVTPEQAVAVVDGFYRALVAGIRAVVEPGV